MGTMIHRNDNLLLAIAMGDAYGAGFEYVNKRDRRHWKQHTLERYVRHPRHEHPPGCYTDDTQMSIAVAEALRDSGVYTHKCFADRFVRCFVRDPREGYAQGGSDGGFQGFLEQFLPIGSPHRRHTASNAELHDGLDFLKHIRPDSTKNGACMRAVPIGVFRVDHVLRVARTQAQTTHNTPDGTFSAVAVALMGHFALWHTEPFSELRNFLRAEFRIHDTYRPLFRRLDGRWTREVRAYPKEGLSVALTTTHAVLDLLMHCTSNREVLDRAVALGGDTDSTAAITLGIASCRFTDPLPAFLERDLEPGNDAYGVAFLKDLGRRLMDYFDQ